MNRTPLKTINPISKGEIKVTEKYPTVFDKAIENDIANFYGQKNVNRLVDDVRTDPTLLTNLLHPDHTVWLKRALCQCVSDAGNVNSNWQGAPVDPTIEYEIPHPCKPANRFPL